MLNEVFKPARADDGHAVPATNAAGSVQAGGDTLPGEPEAAPTERPACGDGMANKNVAGRRGGPVRLPDRSFFAARGLPY